MSMANGNTHIQKNVNRNGDCTEKKATTTKQYLCINTYTRKPCCLKDIRTKEKPAKKHRTTNLYGKTFFSLLIYDQHTLFIPFSPPRRFTKPINANHHGRAQKFFFLHIFHVYLWRNNVAATHTEATIIIIELITFQNFPHWPMSFAPFRSFFASKELINSEWYKKNVID